MRRNQQKREREQLTKSIRSRRKGCQKPSEGSVSRRHQSQIQIS
jgi:hypothetical protein